MFPEHYYHTTFSKALQGFIRDKKTPQTNHLPSPLQVVLWRYKFSQLKGSSDDGKTRVKLLFKNAESQQIEMKVQSSRRWETGAFQAVDFPGVALGSQRNAGFTALRMPLTIWQQDGLMRQLRKFWGVGQEVLGGSKGSTGRYDRKQ